MTFWKSQNSKTKTQGSGFQALEWMQSKVGGRWQCPNWIVVCLCDCAFIKAHGTGNREELILLYANYT